MVNYRKNDYIRITFGDAYESLCAERESGVNPEQCPLLYASSFQMHSEPL